MLHIDNFQPHRQLSAVSKLLAAGPWRVCWPARTSASSACWWLRSPTSALEKDTSLKDATHTSLSHPQIIAELRETLGVLRRESITFTISLESGPKCRCGSTDATRELRSFPGSASVTRLCLPIGERVSASHEIHALTFSSSRSIRPMDSSPPTTRYKDYAISRDLIHWESQSTVRETSETWSAIPESCVNGHECACAVVARLRSDDRAFWFLGPATYVSHAGELPMAITWKLHHPLPGDLFAQFAAAVA